MDGVPPGGKVDPGEAPRAAATRELFEETGVTAAILARPAAAAVRSYKAGWSATLGLSYAAIVPRTTRLRPEDGQPAAWMPLDHAWTTCFQEDRERIRAYASYLSLDADRPRASARMAAPAVHTSAPLRRRSVGGCQ